MNRNRDLFDSTKPAKVVDPTDRDFAEIIGPRPYGLLSLDDSDDYFERLYDRHESV
jgi:hypothetical protein